MIDISKLDKADVLAALYNHSKPQGMGFLHFDPTPMSRDEAARLLIGNPGDNRSAYFDYLKGRVMKVDLSRDQLDPRLYDCDNGQGAVERALEPLLKAAETQGAA